MFSCERYTVLDLSRHFPGPYATHVLAQMGMNVIKVEECEQRAGLGRDGSTAPDLTVDEEELARSYNGLARNKRSIALNLLNPATRADAQEVFYRLAGSADVIVEGYRPGAVHGLGVDYDTVRRYNPKLVYCSLSAFGQDGPYRDRPAHGGQMEAVSGVTGWDSQGRPQRYPVPLADVAGAMYAVSCVMAALADVALGSGGCFLDVSLSASALALMVMPAGDIQLGRHRRSVAPELPVALGFLECADGLWLSTGNLETHFWKSFCEAIGRPEWVASRRATGPEARKIELQVRSLFKTRARDEWLGLLVEAGTCVAPVNSLEEAMRDQQFRHAGMVQTIPLPEGKEAKHLGFPVRVPGQAGAAPRVAPALGEDTRRILGGLGYSVDEVRRLEGAGVVLSTSAQIDRTIS